jgi:hypothetical protein
VNTPNTFVPEEKQKAHHAWFEYTKDKSLVMFYWDPNQQKWIPCPDAYAITNLGGANDLRFFSSVQKFTGYRGPGELIVLELLRLGSTYKPTYVRNYRQATGCSLKEASEKVNKFLDDLWMNHGNQAAGRALTSED